MYLHVIYQNMVRVKPSASVRIFRRNHFQLKGLRQIGQTSFSENAHCIMPQIPAHAPAHIPAHTLANNLLLKPSQSPAKLAYCTSSCPGGGATTARSSNVSCAGAPCNPPPSDVVAPLAAATAAAVSLPCLAIAILSSLSMLSNGFGRPHCTRNGHPAITALP